MVVGAEVELHRRQLVTACLVLLVVGAVAVLPMVVAEVSSLVPETLVVPLQAQRHLHQVVGGLVL